MPKCDSTNKAVTWSAEVAITKISEDQQLAFGWLYVSKRADGSKVVDHSGEVVSTGELEKAAYNFVLKSRQAGEMHEEIGVGRLVESVMFTPEKRKAMGIPDGILPDALWVGFKIDEPEVWKKVKTGQYRMFSLGGKAIRRRLGDSDA